MACRHRRHHHRLLSDEHAAAPCRQSKRRTTMGMANEMALAAFQEATGVKPASGKEADLLQQMSDKAFEMIKVIELERSGIRDGDGYWHGADVMGAMMSEMAE